MAVVRRVYRALERLTASVQQAAGRWLTIGIGVACVGIGVALTMTVIGGLIGIPLLVFGVALLLRGMTEPA